MPANSELGLVAAAIGEARGDGKEKWKVDSSAPFHRPHTRTGIIAYKKAPEGTTVKVADGTNLPVDGFGTVEVDLNQPGITTKPVKMVSVAYVPYILRNLFSTLKAWITGANRSSTPKTVGFLGLPGEELLVFNFCVRKGLFSATGVRQTPSQTEALALAVKPG